MAHQIVCTTQLPADQSHNHAHIVEVGEDTDGDGKAEKHLTLKEVLTMMDNHEIFFTIGEHSKKKIYVIEVNCCDKRYIKTKPDNVLDNNLDELRECKWKS